MEKLKPETAIRCARAAILLSSLKSPSYDSVTNEIFKSQVAKKVENLRLENFRLMLKISRLVKEKQELKLKIRIGVIVHFVFVVILLYNVVYCH